MLNNGYNTLKEEYAVWLKTLGFSDSVAYNCPLSVRDFLNWLQAQGIGQINQLETGHLYRYFNHLETRPNKRRSGGLSDAHLNKNFDAVDKFLEFLHQMGAQNVPQPTNYRIEQTKPQVRDIEVLTQEEIKSLFGSIEHSFADKTYKARERMRWRLKLIFALYYACGLRRNEGYKLTPNEIDFDRRTIFIEQGKGYKDRLVPMNDTVYNTLHNYIYGYRNTRKLPHDRLFTVGTYVLNTSLQGLQQTCDNKELKNKHITLHTLRHSIATHLLENGMGIDNIARFLGHSSLESTQVYTHIVNR